MATNVPPFRAVSTTMYRERRKTTPQLPTSRSNIQLPERCTKLADGRDFLQADDGLEDKILLFATDNAIERLCSSREVFVDGTLYTCPRLFCQLFTLQVEAYGKVLPMAFAFLPDKSQNVYQRLFGILKNRAQALGQEFSPAAVRSDFEQAIISAVRHEFPYPRITGCLFHYGQALWIGR